jgi:hypothetical protein
LLELIGDPAAPARPGPKRSKVADRIADIPAQKLPDFWRKCLPQLRTAYRDTCAYLGMKIHPATGAASIDHFRPKSTHQQLAYEWSNFRLAAQQVNTNKGEHGDVMDPFEVHCGWFALDIGTFEVRPSTDLDSLQRTRVELTISRLKLNEPTFCKTREEYHDWYHGLRVSSGKGLPLTWLRDECPYVAYELDRQGRLREEIGARQTGVTSGLLIPERSI